MEEKNEQRNTNRLMPLIFLCGIALGIVVGSLSAVWLFRNCGNGGGTPEYTMESEAETVLLLGSDRWDGLTDEERIGVLKTVVKIERCRLGISFETGLIPGTLEENTVACYNHNDHAIILNTAYLGTRSAGETIETICHEMYHAYQHELVGLYRTTGGKYRPLMIFDDIRAYESEFRDYSGDASDEEAYYYQTCEVDAREYAENERRRYFRFIALYGREDEENTEYGKE